MRSILCKVLVFAAFATACSSATKPAPSTPAQPRAAAGLQMKLFTVHVDDQDKALRFYTDVLGFAKKDDVSNEGFRWLSVTDAAGVELQLALSSDPAAKAYQQAMFQQNQPALMFYTDNVVREYERIKARGAEFTMPPTDVTYANIAQLKDGCGNLIQITQLER